MISKIMEIMHNLCVCGYACDAVGIGVGVGVGVVAAAVVVVVVAAVAALGPRDVIKGSLGEKLPSYEVLKMQ